MNRQERRAGKSRAKPVELDRVIAIHEAGHAVGRYLFATKLGLTSEQAISHIDVGMGEHIRTSVDGKMELRTQAVTFGPTLSKDIQDIFRRDVPIDADKPPPTYEVLFGVIAKARAEGADIETWLRGRAFLTVMGPMAEAKLLNRPFKDVWNSYECESDVFDLVREALLAKLETPEIVRLIDNAAQEAAEIIDRPEVWRAITELADNLPAAGRMPGKRAAAIIAAALLSA